MKRILENMDRKKIALITAALAVLLLSVFVISKAAADPANHTQTLESLDEKKEDVLAMTATSAASATAIAAIPGDATTPVANKLADLTSYFLIILMVIFLEKYLVTLTGYAAFNILIPLACILFIAGVCAARHTLKVWAAKIAVFGLVLFFIIPASMQVSSIIEETYEVSMENAIQEAEKMTEEINESTDSDGNIIEQALDKIAGGVSGLLEKGEQLLNQFIESIAVMFVTSCLIPIAVLMFVLWLVKVMFEVQINVPRELPKKISRRLPGGGRRNRRMGRRQSENLRLLSGGKG